MRICLVVVAAAVCLLTPLEPARAIDLKTKVSGGSTGSGTLSRTIIDISPPTDPQRPASSHTVTVPIASGSSAVAVAKALIDSINTQIGSFGFTAAFASLPDSTFVRMSRASLFSSCDQGTVPGVSVKSGDLLVLMEHLGHQCGTLGAAASQAIVTQASVRTVPLHPLGGAGVPLTANCSIEPRVVACPAGDLPFHATLRDINHNPTLGSLIIDFSQCTQLSQCTVLPSNYVTAQANGLGEAAISVSMGAGCAGNQIGVHTDTGFLGNRALASPDQDGDLDVDLNDAIILASKVGTNDPTGDLDGDGAISGSCGTTGVPGGGEAGLPVLTLRGLWPNILRADESFTLDFSMPERASLVLELFDVVGRRGGMEVLGMTEPGPHRMEWRVPAGTRPGLYLLRLRSSAGGRSALSLVVR